MRLFRIKNNYITADEESGRVVKVKEEYLVSAENYTDAECFITKYNAEHNTERFGPAEYEIVKEKFNYNNIELNDVLNFDDRDTTCGLIEHFFVEDTDRLFAVTVRFFGDKEAGEKSYNSTYYVPARNAESAIKYVKTNLIKEDADYMITKTVADNVASIFLTPSIHQELIDRV